VVLTPIFAFWQIYAHNFGKNGWHHTLMDHENVIIATADHPLNPG
jgi:hypothetical protein